MSSPCDFVTTPDAHRPGAVREGSRSPPAGDLELQPSAASLDRKTVTMKDPRHGTCVALPMRPMPKHPTRISALLGALALHSATVACTSDVSLPAPGAAVPAVEKAPATVSRRADVNALLGLPGQPAPWESEGAVLGAERGALRKRLRTAELERYGVDLLTVPLPSATSARLWFGFDSAFSAQALEHAAANNDGFPHYTGELEARCSSVEVRGEFLGEDRNAIRKALATRLGAPIPTEDEHIELFFDHERQRRITWFGIDDDELPVLVIDPFIPLSTLFGPEGRVQLGKTSWPGVRDATAFVMAGAREGWSCQYGYGGGERIENGECSLPSTEVSDGVRIELALHPDGWQGMRLSGADDPTGRNPLPALEAALEASYGAMETNEAGTRLFPHGVTLTARGREPADAWTVQIPHQGTSPDG